MRFDRGAAGDPDELAGTGETGVEADVTDELERGAERERAAELERADEREALREQLLRLAAEFDNYRKREGRERGEAWTRAKADLVEKLLEPIDDLRRVAHPEAGSAGAAAAGLLVGVALVERKMLQALAREGLAPIEAEGALFDPALHEAILTQPTDDPALDGRVAHVALTGYRFADRLLRPARVVVWKLQG